MSGFNFLGVSGSGGKLKVYSFIITIIPPPKEIKRMFLTKCLPYLLITISY
jgi:hypothetical protein